MRTSLIELQQIEEHIFSKGSTPGPISVALLTDATMPEKVMWQQETYTLVQQYGRARLKAELEAVHQQLFTESRYARFRRKVMRAFRGQ